MLVKDFVNRQNIFAENYTPIQVNGETLTIKNFNKYAEKEVLVWQVCPAENESGFYMDLILEY